MNKRTPKVIKLWERAYKNAKVVRLNDYRMERTTSPFIRPSGKAKVYSFETRKPVPRFNIGDRVWIDRKNPWGPFIVTKLLTGFYGWTPGEFNVHLKTESGQWMLPMPSERLITEEEYQASIRGRRRNR